MHNPLRCCLYSSIYQSNGEDILASLRELEDALCEVSPVERPEGLMQNSVLHQECLYYLNAYGTHLGLISFYMRHDCVTEALTYLLKRVRLKLLTASISLACLDQYLAIFTLLEKSKE